jgi:hypothetical protein
MHQHSRRCAESGQPLAFPSGIVPAEPPVAAAPDLPALFPQQFPAGRGEPLELQAELGHARREIQHLQRQIAQLQAELSEAHEIFRQIHEHPIAGPLVRVRQKLLQTMRQWTGKSSAPAPASKLE